MITSWWCDMQQSRLSLSLSARLWLYCAERFPLASYGLMTVLFSVAGITLSTVLRLEHRGVSFGDLLNWQHLLGASLTIFALFFQLRVADEHKDKDNDALYLPSRPVPRGLITLNQLSFIAFALGFMQLAICAMAGPLVLLILLATWLYLFLMGREFFCPTFLKARPFVYMVTHMFIMLFCDLLITSFDFSHGTFDLRLLFFFGASFFNGMVIELGRKIFDSKLEVPGIQSYSSLLGVRGATSLLLVCSLISQCLLLLLMHTDLTRLLFGLTFLVFDCFYVVSLGKAMSAGGAAIASTSTKCANLSVVVCYLAVLIFKSIEVL